MTHQGEANDVMVFECDFEEPPEKVWRALTEREWLDAWLSTGEPSAEGRGTPTEYEVLDAEPPRLLRYGCRDREDVGDAAGAEQVLESTVTFELSRSAAGGTHLRLTHTDFRITSQARRHGIVCSLQQARVSRMRKTPITSCVSSSALRRAA